MYEDMTFEKITERCLDRVSSSIDKREGSVIYDAIAPAVAELAIMYIEMSSFLDRVFPDTEYGEDLTKKARERGVFRTESKASVRKGCFETSTGGIADIPIGTRFSGGDLNYTVTEKIEDGNYKMLCETAGSIGNQYRGTLFPIDYIEGLGSANLTDILINGEDEEDDESLRSRYFASLKSQAYGGNIADYKSKTELLQGVGSCKVIPVWNGGGTVKIIFIDSDWGIPSLELIDSVQTAIDPVQNQGAGDGIAPIGHIVTVEGVEGVKINVSFKLTFENSYSWDTKQREISGTIKEYFSELAHTWGNRNNLIVRKSQLETKILGISGIIDIMETRLNTQTENITLRENQIPILGDVINEA